MSPYAPPDRVVSGLWGRPRIEELLSPLLAPLALERLWAEAWGRLGLTPANLTGWYQQFGAELAALAVASGLTEAQLCEHFAGGDPDRATLEMLADLNCYPHVTPAARPVAPAPWAKHLRGSPTHSTLTFASASSR